MKKRKKEKKNTGRQLKQQQKTKTYIRIWLGYIMSICNSRPEATVNVKKGLSLKNGTSLAGADQYKINL